MATASVDVVIPVHNGAQTVESAVASIQAQTIRGIRIIIVNDGSTDATQSIVERLARDDARVTLINQANSGIVDALNAGLAACTADITARHDADDLAAPDRFERQLACLRDNPDCAAVSGAVTHIDASGRVLGGIFRLPSPDLADLDRYPQLEPYLMHPFLMARHAAVQAIGGYRYAFHAEDSDLYWRLREKGRLVNMPDLLGSYRIHAQSITGASIVNGRISALNSQRAGMSARRRRAGRPDITFDKESLAEYKAAGSLEGIIRLGSRGLDAEEARRLAAATCAKLLELASYRPYELELEDCAIIHDTIVATMPGMTPDNRGWCSRMLSGTAARIAAKGDMRAALRLAPRRLYPQVAARLALRTVFPVSFRHVVRRTFGRPAFVK